MKKLQFLLILLVAGTLFVPAVSAETVIIDIDDESVSSTDDVYTGGSNRTVLGGDSGLRGVGIYVKQIQKVTDPYSLVYFFDGNETWLHISDPSIRYNSSTFTVTSSSQVVATGTITYNIYPGSNAGYIVIEFDTWTPGTLTGDKYFSIRPENGLNGMRLLGYSGGSGTSNNQILLTQVAARYYAGAGFVDDPYIASGIHTQNSVRTFKSQITGDTDENGAYVVVVTTDSKYPSTVKISPKYHGEYITVIEKTNEPLVSYTGSQEYSPIKVEIYASLLDRWYTHYLYANGDDPTVEPTPTEEPVVHPVMRQGTVTMTDHNGTSISGFEVTAENVYTGQSYTFSTDTDIAVISLPMDRTITIRNPQTGEYEETTVGYYRFFGQSPGYKMLNEDGIQVAVMPQKYSSYQLCDILVTPESGYLSGQHKFQIRSRSDNSVLQTGTISAQSATTGEWYNTTVSGGIAMLILPYDTSNPISQYAGNYYVYATSPGYIDSDYGTQIVVMPHTVSEIHDIYLTPIGGIPTPGNVTLRIQVFSETGPGIVNAKIFIAGVLGEGVSVWDTYTTSSTGYLEVSVPGNSTYDIVASAAGYYDSARRIEVFTENPSLIEIKLYLSGGPTVEPTSQPTGWVTLTPTPTSRPTEVAPGNSPIDNFIIMFENMGFNPDFALWLTGLFLICIAAVIGHILAGKFGAMLGTPIGIVMTTGLGLIPLWGMVILLVIAALVIAKMVMR